MVIYFNCILELRRFVQGCAVSQHIWTETQSSDLIFPLSCATYEWVMSSTKTSVPYRLVKPKLPPFPKKCFNLVYCISKITVGYKLPSFWELILSFLPLYSSRILCIRYYEFLLKTFSYDTTFWYCYQYDHSFLLLPNL